MLRIATEDKDPNQGSSLSAEVCYEEAYRDGEVTQTKCCLIPKIELWKGLPGGFDRTEVNVNSGIVSLRI